MTEITQFIVENQEYVFYILAFFVFVYFARFFGQLVFATFNARKGLKITGLIK